MNEHDCHLCPGECVRSDCPHALDQPWRPGTEEEELGAAHEPEADAVDSEPLLRIVVTSRSDGMDVATTEWDGRKFSVTSRHGAEMAVCRELHAAGRAESAWVVVDSRDGRTRLYGRSTRVLAGLTVSEPDRGLIKFARWSPHPRSIGAA